MGVRGFRLRGSAALREHALDLLHVHDDVLGVEERDDEFDVWLPGDVPERVRALVGLRVDELPAAPEACSGLEHDAPVLVAPDLCVRPPWVPAPAGFRGLDLVVPRGSAFGSGEHASTRAALLALHRAWPARHVRTFVDVGTGSGILAAFAERRGAASIVACDIDAWAVRTAAALVPRAAMFAGSARALALRADVVAANMTAAELAADLDALVALRGAQGLLVLGGLRGSGEVDACRRACAALGVRDVASFAVEEFTALVFGDDSRR